MRYTYRYRSFFWPALLILAGVIALLVNTGQVPVERLDQLIDLWPLILVVIGLELIVRRTVHGVTGDVAAALIVLLAIAGAAAYVTVTPNPSATKSHDSSAQLGNVTEASLQINVGGAKVNVSDTGAAGELYRAHIDYNGADPRVQFDPGSGELLIDQHDQGITFFQSRKFVLNLQVNPAVAWSIAINSGASTLSMSLPHTHVSALTLNTGASTEDLTLGVPSGIVDVEMNGAALTVHLHRPGGTPASVEVSGLGLNLVADGKSYHAVGHIAATQDLGSAGYQIRVNGAACNVTVDTAAGSD